MKQSGIQFDRAQRIEVTKGSRARLVEQNKKLSVEVYRLEQVINNIIEKSVTNEFQFISEDEHLKMKYQREHETQLKYIAKLKKQIKAIRSNFAEHKYQEVKVQENQLVFYQRDRDKLLSERETLIQRKKEKNDALRYHQPINNQTAETGQNYRKCKAQNGELKYKIHELQREVAKFHKIKEMAKTARPRLTENADAELTKMQNEITHLKRQMKKIQQKWKDKIDSLDFQYFSLKQIFMQQELELERLDKQWRNSDIKKFSIRDEAKVQLDKERMKSVIISPNKRKEIQDLIEAQYKGKLKKIESNLKNNGLKKNIQKANVGKSQNQVQQQKNYQSVSINPLIEKQTDKKSQHKQEEESIVMQRQTKYLQKHEQKDNIERPSKQKKMVQSVAVGTSFYYVEE